jgi:hypothetical protein
LPLQVLVVAAAEGNIFGNIAASVVKAVVGVAIAGIEDYIVAL